MQRFAYEAADEAGTAALGAALASVLPDGAVVALDGPLGAGKTRLVQAVAAATGIEPRTVVSPTFVLVHEYQGQRPIWHFDAYRLRDEQEFIDLGPEEYFARPGWTFIEWAERVACCLPPERLEIRILVTGPTTRRFEIVGRGSPYDGVVRRLAALGGGHPHSHPPAG